MNRIDTRIDTIAHIVLASVAAVLLGAAIVGTHAAERETQAAIAQVVELPKVVMTVPSTPAVDTKIVELPQVTVIAARMAPSMAELAPTTRRV